MKTLLSALVFIFASVASADAQSLRTYEQKALEARLTKNFPAALAYEKMLVEKDEERIDARYRGGEAAMQVKAFPEAIQLFGGIPDVAKKAEYAFTDFYLGVAHKRLGNYPEAIESFQKFIDQWYGNLVVTTQKAKDEIAQCEWAIESRRSPIDVEISPLGDFINSTSSELSPLRFADKIYFTSPYQTPGSDAPVMRIFSSNQKYPPHLAGVNSSDPTKHTSHASLSADGRRMYFTVCENGEYENNFRCEIFYRDRNYDGNWGAPVALPRHINVDSFTTTQPSIGYDKILKREVLYFASNRSGGKGGLDIWASEIERDDMGKIDNFSEPYSLPFNTPNDEVTPYFHNLSQTLYFSSDGLKSMGGLDIFSTKKNTDGEWGEAQNLGYPLNSSSDDLYYTFHSGSHQAYFSSNRPGARCDEPVKGCFCNDIYSISFNLKLNLWVLDKEEQAPLSNVRVDLFDMETGEMKSFRVNTTGNFFSFPLEMERRYLVRATADGFETTTSLVNTLEMSSFAKFERNLFLKKVPELGDEGSDNSFPAEFFSDSAALLMGGG